MCAEQTEVRVILPLTVSLTPFQSLFSCISKFSFADWFLEIDIQELYVELYNAYLCC